MNSNQDNMYMGFLIEIRNVGAPILMHARANLGIAVSVLQYGGLRQQILLNTGRPIEHLFDNDPSLEFMIPTRPIIISSISEERLDFRCQALQHTCTSATSCAIGRVIGPGRLFLLAATELEASCAS
ncbi:hypothetical protein E4U45_006344, partial [Claviceps purpurea]